MDHDEAVLRELRPGDADWIVTQHARLYARDEGFDESFGILVARIVADFLNDHDAEVERAWVAEAGGERLGCIFCFRHDATTAKLRLFLLLPEARGRGLGRRLLAACMDHARERGFEGMTLWTHESHRAACALYARTGWVLQSSTPAHSFGQDVVEQHWTYRF